MNRRKFLKWSSLGALATFAGGAFASRSLAASRYYNGPVSDHFDGRYFFNPNGEQPNNFFELMRWQLGGGRATWPVDWPSPFPSAVPAARVDGDRLVVTMVGHAALLIQTAGFNILTDPVWSERASPVTFAGPKRVNPPGIKLADLPKIDVVLVTHNHYDHLDITTLKTLAERDGCRIVTPLGNDRIIVPAIAETLVTTMDWGESIPVADGVTIHCEPCHHWSARGLGDRRMALWSAFLIETPGGKIYHIGDTGFHQGINYRTIREKHGAIRLANLPFGAYEPRWFMRPQHQNPDEAVQGMLTSGAAYVAGHHWGTFRLTNEAIDEPLKALEAALAAAGIARERFRGLRPGEVFEVPAVAA